MTANTNLHPVIGENATLEIPGNYQPIHLEDTVGAVFLGFLSVILLIGWMRAEARYRKLLKSIMSFSQSGAASGRCERP